MAKAFLRRRPDRRYLALFVILALAVYVLLPQLKGFSSTWQQLREPRPAAVAAAIALTTVTYFAGAMTYKLLAFSRLAYGRTVLVQLAAMFVNRLLPAGVGALGTNYVYLHRQKHTPVQAAAVVALNNLLGFVGHFMIVGWCLWFYSGPLQPTAFSWRLPRLVVAALVAVVTIALVAGRRRLAPIVADSRRQLLAYRKRPARLGGALLSSMVLTLANVSAFYTCASALSVQLPFVVILLIFTLGVGAGTSVPTPGGLGAFEAGLVAGLVAYKVDGSTALAVALLYRLVSYWLALAVGAVAFGICERRKFLAD